MLRTLYKWERGVTSAPIMARTTVLAPAITASLLPHQLHSISRYSSGVTQTVEIDGSSKNTQTHVNSATVTQSDDNDVSINVGKHSNVKDNVVVTTSTPPNCYSDPIECTVIRLCQFNNKPIKITRHSCRSSSSSSTSRITPNGFFFLFLLFSKGVLEAVPFMS
jgi:hypothetical protein